jgi:hypothetical protein
MPINPARTRDLLQALDFTTLFIEELGWSHPPARNTLPFHAGDTTYTRKPIAQLAGVTVFEITTPDGTIPDASARAAIHKHVSADCYENLLIFLDAKRTQSLWLWAKREQGKLQLRSHLYVKGQPGDLFLSKLAALVVDISELDEQGNISIVEVASRLKQALDIETVTKRFFNQFAEEHSSLLDHIHGIPDDHDRRWYASVLLNRLMFIWFLQKKLFLADGNADYLPALLAASARAGKDRFFSHTLRDLFFEGFAKPASRRACVGPVPLGDIPYLNGGLFLPHGIEARLEGDALFTGPFTRIRIPDAAFEGVFRLFAAYSWSLDDTPGGKDNEINPDVLGYIFEKYINQKEFGAYYTRREITEYLCEQTINQIVLDAANRHADAALQLHQRGLRQGPAPRRFENLADLLLHADGTTCRLLLQEDIPRLSLLDPACGSGAFLVAAMRTLLGLTTALIGRCQAIGEKAVLQWLEAEQRKHKAPLAYWVKKKIITENLFGVDLMEEAVEIAKLRLFLALVASAEKRDQLEPLPNIEFNLMPGNSLIGLLHIDPSAYDAHAKPRNDAAGEQTRMTLSYPPGLGDLGFTVESTVAPTRKETIAAYLAKQRSAKYEELLREKNRLIALYKSAGDWSPTNQAAAELKELTGLREKIEAANRAARHILNQLLLREFQGLGIQYEQAAWDTTKGKEAKPAKRPLTLADIEKLTPFHWAYEFDEIIVHRGGFDAIITNPPWDVFQTDEKEFSQKYEATLQKKKIRIVDWKKQFAGLMRDEEFRSAWLEYASSFPHVATYLKNAPQYRNQISVIDGRQQASKLNLYKNFLEQCVHLLRPGGRAGIVIPSGIYTDLGAMQLRNMLFETCRVTGLFGFENRRKIFEGVDSRFKFVVLSFEKGGRTQSFPAAFMRHDPADLARFPGENDLRLTVPLIKRLSPGSFSMMEFKSPLDIQIAEKMLRFPLLGEEIQGTWNVKFTQEFNMTTDSDLFRTQPGPGRLPLYEGKMIWQFQHAYAPPRYWVDEKEGRKRLLGGEKDVGQKLGYQGYRIGFRDVARNTDTRTLIAGLVPRTFCGNTLPLVVEPTIAEQICLLLGLLNSLSADWMIRQKVSAHCNFFYMNQLPIPRLTENDPAFRPLVERAARLVGTAPEFDDLLKEVFGPKASHATHGVTDPQSRLTLRAEIDALVARLYDLTEAEFTHILGTFPLVDLATKQLTLETYRHLLRLGHFPHHNR